MALEKPYFIGFFAPQISLAEREGFEPPIGLHLCRISSAVHSTTLPPLQAIENIAYLLEWSIPKWAFATALLPNVFGALLLGDLKSFVNARGGIFLHAGQNVAVKIERVPTRDGPIARSRPSGERQQPTYEWRAHGANHGTGCAAGS